MRTIQDFATYLTRLVRDGILIGAAIFDGIVFVVKSFVPSTRRPPILDESWTYLAVFAVGLVIAAYRRDRDLRTKLSQVTTQLARQRSALCRELEEGLVRLKFTIERRDKQPIPMDQILRIQGLANDLGDEYVIAECKEMENILQRNYDGRYYIASLFEDAIKDYDSVRVRVDHILKYLRENQAALESKGSVKKH